MRYEFRRNGTVVGSAQWEGPGQVTLELAEEGARPAFDRFFAAEETYLAAGFDTGASEELQTRRRDWTPWEFERACRAFAGRHGFRARRVPSGAVERRAPAAQP